MKNKIVYKIASSEETIEARKFVYKRYLEVGYIKQPQDNEIFDDKYVKDSIYFVAIEENKVVGAIRLVKYMDKGLPILNEFKIYDKYQEIIDGFDRKEVVEVGNLVAKPGNSIGKGLYAITIKYALKQNKHYWVAGIDKNLLDKLKEHYPIFHILYKQIGEPMDYVGSISVPIMFRIRVFMLLFI